MFVYFPGINNPLGIVGTDGFKAFCYEFAVCYRVVNSGSFDVELAGLIALWDWKSFKLGAIGYLSLLILLAD